MLENAKRHIILVLLVLIGAAVCLGTLPLRLGTDLSGGSELHYELDKTEVQATKDTELNVLMDQTVSIIRDRLDPDGTKDIVVSRRGPEGVFVELPGMTGDEARVEERKITQLGLLEMRIVADSSFNEGGITFNLDQEKRRLQDWIAKPGNREGLLVDPGLIRNFNRLSSDEGGPQSQKLRWLPHRVTESLRPGKGGPSWGQRFHGMQGEIGNGIVPLFTDQDLASPPKPGAFLVEFVPINMAEMHFSGEDLDGSKVAAGVDQDGGPAVLYTIVGERQTEYADWTEKYIGKHSAIILDGIVRSAPVFISRIPGRGQITGFNAREAEQLADVLKRGSLKVHLKLQSKVTIGPTLGQRSIELGGISILAGGAFVMLFMLFYYRLSGVISLVAMSLNVALVFGAFSLVRATLTLPGLAGLVLTIGMAVDANILIYERIREELKRGKDLLQAVRHGFDKAFVTILDANVTTFLAGAVLYFIGVGPVRGFAVTMMIGIATSLFTAFFVTRLLFHFLLLNKERQTLNMREWFSNLNVNFLRYRKVALAISSLIIIGGLVTFFAVEPRKKYGLDFTGGLAARIMTAEPRTPKEIEDALTKNPAALALFPSRTINTVGDVKNTGKATTFSIKLKVEDASASEREVGASAMAQKYESTLAQALQGMLAPTAFSSGKLQENFRAGSSSLLASIEANFGDTVSQDNLAGVLASRGLTGSAVQVTPLTDKHAKEARRYLLEFDVAADDVRYQNPRAAEENKGKSAAELQGLVDSALATSAPNLADYTRNLLKARDGDSAKLPELSDPIPDISEIGGRMVGELRNAAIGSMLVALFLIVMYIRVRFHEYKWGIGAVVALIHDVLITLGIVVLFNRLGIVDAEIDLAMIAAFLTIIGYSINDTIVIFDRIRENLNEQERLGDHSRTLADTINWSINQTLSRTILTSATTMLVVLAQFVVNFHAGTALEGLSFALIIGILTGTYSTIFIASPVVLFLRNREKPGSADISDSETVLDQSGNDKSVVAATAK